MATEARVESRTDRLYMQALMLQEKKRAKAAELDRECTFSPRLVAAERRAAAPAADGAVSTAAPGGPKAPRHERLYAQAIATRGKLEAEREKLDPECTFSPRLESKSSAASLRSSKEVFSQLYAKAVAQQARQEEMRKVAGLRDCTFAPALNPDSRRRRTAGGVDLDVGDKKSPPSSRKLYDPDWWKKRLSAEFNDPDNRQSGECTFAPRLISKPVSTNSAPSGQAVFDKLHGDAVKKAAKLHEREAEAKAAKEVDCTFTPDLSLTKDVLEGHSMNVGTAHERLYRQAMELNQKRSVRPDPADQGCTFAPSLSQTSKAMAAVRRSAGTDRLHEMYAEGLMKQKARGVEAVKPDITKDDEEHCTFKPTITEWPGMDANPHMPVHERLYSNAFSRTQTRMPDDDVDGSLSRSASQPLAMEGSRRYMQGGELYLI